MFLQRYFLKVANIVSGVTAEPLSNDLPIEELWTAAASALATRGLQHAARYFLSGEDRWITESSDLLRLAENGFGTLGEIERANTLSSIRRLLPVMQNRSTWTMLGEVFPGNRLWERYLKLLARGVGDDVIHRPAIAELWPSQIGAIKQGILRDDSSKIIRMPASAGKTRIAELLIISTLTKYVDAK